MVQAINESYEQSNKRQSLLDRITTSKSMMFISLICAWAAIIFAHRELNKNAAISMYNLQHK